MDYGRQRYSPASTSTLFIPEENSDEEDENHIDTSEYTYTSKQQRRDLNASSSSRQNGLPSITGRGASKGALQREQNSHGSADSHDHTTQHEMTEETPPTDDEGDEIASKTDDLLDEPQRLEEGGNTAEDPLDTLIRLSSELLRTSKAILASSKRVNVVNGAIAQTAYSQEHELRRHLESLEQGDRFMSLMSRDAHYILHPTSEEPSLPSSSSYGSAPQVRLRSRLSDGASNPSRARTMYIHANIGSTSEAMPSLPTSPLCDKSSEQQQLEEQVVQEISGLFSQKQAGQPQQQQQHTSPKPNIASPTLSSTSSSSPSTFLSSLFSRRSYASTTSTADSLPAKEPVETSKKQDAKSLLSALAGNTSTARPSKTSPERISSSQVQKQHSTASFASVAVSDSYTSQSADRSPSPSPSPLPSSDTRPSHHRRMSSAAFANAQISAIMADNAHMTVSSLSSRGSKGHTRSSFSLSENLLRATTGGSSYTAPSPLQHKKMEESERAVLGKRRSVNRMGVSQVPKVQISNVPIMATREGRFRELSAPI